MATKMRPLRFTLAPFLAIALFVSACSAEETPSAPNELGLQDATAQVERRPVATPIVNGPPSIARDTEPSEPPPQRLAEAVEEKPPAAPAPPSRFKQGVHYTVLTPTQPTSSSPDKIEVAEVFWYGCGHCYNFEPFITKWLEAKRADVAFVRLPVMWGPLHRMHARAFYTAELLGVLDRVHEPMFREIHLNKNRLNTEQALEDFFANHGVDREEFRKAFRSFTVETKLKRTDSLLRRYGADSTPLMVVNGKYRADGTSAQGFENLMAVVDELVDKEARRQ